MRKKKQRRPVVWLANDIGPVVKNQKRIAENMVKLFVSTSRMHIVDPCELT